jgi:hypothetical protein
MERRFETMVVQGGDVADLSLGLQQVINDKQKDLNPLGQTIVDVKFQTLNDERELAFVVLFTIETSEQWVST